VSFLATSTPASSVRDFGLGFPTTTAVFILANPLSPPTRP
jgi:hypothetical protein